MYNLGTLRRAYPRKDIKKTELFYLHHNKILDLKLCPKAPHTISFSIKKKDLVTQCWVFRQSFATIKMQPASNNDPFWLVGLNQIDQSSVRIMFFPVIFRYLPKENEISSRDYQHEIINVHRKIILVAIVSYYKVAMQVFTISHELLFRNKYLFFKISTIKLIQSFGTS